MNDDVVRVALTDIARTALAPRAALVLPRLIVAAGPGAPGGLAAARGGLHPDPPRVGAHRPGSVLIHHPRARPSFMPVLTVNPRWKLNASVGDR